MRGETSKSTSNAFWRHLAIASGAVEKSWLVRALQWRTWMAGFAFEGSCWELSLFAKVCFDGTRSAHQAQSCKSWHGGEN